MGRKIRVAAAVAALSLTAATAFGRVEFQAAQSERLPLPAATVATADLNRDGLMDTAVLTPSGKEVLIYLAADGTATRLSSRLTERFGDSLRRIALGDLDRDGFADLVAADAGAGGVWVLLGSGDGTFGDPLFTQVASTPDAIAIGDFDGNNGRDLAVADSGRDTVFVLMNNGAAPPAFRRAAELPMGEHPEEVLAVDLTRDGRPDVVTLNIGYTRLQEIGVRRFLGMQGDAARFDAVERTVVGEKPSQMLATELTGDGAAEIVMLSRRAGDPNDDLVILRNDGDGRFTVNATPILCPFFTGGVPCRLFALAAADFDRNNRIDLAVAMEDPRHPRGAPRETDAVQLLPGRGDGTVAFAGVTMLGEAPGVLVAGHVTSDCVPDLIAGTQREPTLQVLEGSSAAGLRLNGDECSGPAECASGRCSDARCCAVACAADERCNLPGNEGVCRPVPPPLRSCNADRNCPDERFPFCADDVCCNDPCPSGQCDRPGFEGLCIPGGPPGGICGDDRECESGFCSVNFRCCLQRCDEGYCDQEGFCRPLGELTDPCLVDEECGSGICDTFDGICCNRRCEEFDAFCDGETGRCIRSTELRGTGAGAPAPLTPCVLDCDGDAAVSISELVRMVNAALGTGSLSTCAGADPSTARCISISDIVLAVKQALTGCNPA